MATYIYVLVREDRLLEVFEVLTEEPHDRAADLPDVTNENEPLARDDELADVPGDEVEAERDDETWDAFWAVPDNVQEHLAPRSDLIHAILRASLSTPTAAAGSRLMTSRPTSASRRRASPRLWDRSAGIPRSGV
jgi:hypothetical protein